MSNQTPISNLYSDQGVARALESLGFKYFGKNESNVPLYIAPNGQIIEFSIAYDFLRSQMQAANNDNSGGIESFPTMPQSIDVQKNVLSEQLPNNTDEKKIDNVLDIGPVGDKVLESEDVSLQRSSVSTPTITFSSGYSEFENINLDLSNPDNLETLNKYIADSSRKSNSNPAKWLSMMFEKSLKKLIEDTQE